LMQSLPLLFVWPDWLIAMYTTNPRLMRPTMSVVGGQVGRLDFATQTAAVIVHLIGQSAPFGNIQHLRRR
jgi:hypothetical protein